MFAGAVLVIAVGVAGLVLIGGGKHPAPIRPTSFGVGIVRCTFVDATRSTQDYDNSTTRHGRVLVTEVRYPTTVGAHGRSEIPGAAPARSFGPYPLVIFGHGYDLTPDTYSRLLDRWVAAGFVVAAPLFPDTNRESVTKVPFSIRYIPEADDVNQPADMAFVARSMQSAATTLTSICPVAHRLVASHQLAMAGQSDGASTAVALGSDPKYVNSGLHIRAVVDLSGELFGAGTLTPDHLATTSSSPALLVTQSATDTCNPPPFATAIYNSLALTTTWFLRIGSAHHLPPYIGTDRPAFNVVAAVSTAFLRDEFSGTDPSTNVARLGNADPSVASLTHGGAAPAMATLTQSSTSCYLTS
jgi:dienelactone hydrolase